MPNSPDHEYFLPKTPKFNEFRRSFTELLNPPQSPVISERAIGKQPSQTSTPTRLSHLPTIGEGTALTSDVEKQDQHIKDSESLLTESLKSPIPSPNPNVNGIKRKPVPSSAEQRQQQLTTQGRLDYARRLQRMDKFLGYTLSIFSVILAVIMDGILVFVLHTFYKTRDIPAPGRVGPWAVGTELWPAFMLLTASTLTFVIDGATFIAACCTFRKRKRDTEDKEGDVLSVAARAESTLVKCGYAAFVAKWFVIATLYRTGKTTKDLW